MFDFNLEVLVYLLNYFKTLLSGVVFLYPLKKVAGIYTEGLYEKGNTR